MHSEYDYFTAVDDLAPEDNAGAGHLGTVEFNSSTLYRYATVNVSELKKWVKNPEHIVRVFTEAFIYAMPTGKQGFRSALSIFSKKFRSSDSNPTKKTASER